MSLTSEPHGARRAVFVAAGGHGRDACTGSLSRPTRSRTNSGSGAACNTARINACRIHERPEGTQGALHVYIEGDGTPYVARYDVAADPTPRHPLMLQLMTLDPASSVYVGRPCYFGLANDPSCTPRDWTLDRFSPRIVDSMARVIEQMRTGRETDAIELYGHSGGGALAVLLAERLGGVQRRRHDRWQSRYRRVDGVPRLHAAGRVAEPGARRAAAGITGAAAFCRRSGQGRSAGDRRGSGAAAGCSGHRRAARRVARARLGPRVAIDPRRRGGRGDKPRPVSGTGEPEPGKSGSESERPAKVWLSAAPCTRRIGRRAGTVVACKQKADPIAGTCG